MTCTSRTAIHLSILLSLLAVPAVQAQVAPQDSLALVAIYNATDGPNWRSNPGWLTGPVSGWGFLAVEGNRVTGLGLANLGLTGTLPSEIGNLTELRQLGLEYNSISGALPSEMGNLTKLERLTIQRNQFSGPIPATIGSLTELREFVFWGNRLTGIPESIGNLYRLTILNGFENQIAGLPERIGDLFNLVVLNLNGNALQGGIPSSIGGMTSLQELDLGGNPDLTGPIPSGIGNATALKRFFAYDTALTGPIPESIGQLVSLERLWISSAQLDGPLPAGLGSMTMLEDLNLNNNRITGPLPATLGNLQGIQQIYLFNNELSGPIPASISGASELRTLSLENNQLSGAVPATLASMPNLTGLSIRDNDIQDLPSFTAAPVSTFNLDLAGNRLEFDDLQANAGVRMSSYAPQQAIPTYVTDMGNEWVISCRVGGEGNSYQWFYEDRTAVGNSTQEPKLVVPKPVTRRYYCEAKNAQFVDLILTTELWPEATTQPQNQAPVAVIQATPTSGTAPLTVVFDGLNSTDPDGDSVSASWNFGDGSLADGPQHTHTYATAGTYTATLTVTDTHGAAGTATVEITATAAPASGDIIAEWMFSELDGRDESGNGHHAQMVGSPIPVIDPDYPDHQDLYLDGNSVLRVPDSALLSPPTDMSFEILFRLDNAADYCIIANHADTGQGSDAGWIILNVAGETGVGLVTSTGTVTLSLDSGSVKSQRWHHLAFTLGDGTARLYLDGTLRDESAAGSLLDPTNDLFLGGPNGSVVSSGGGVKGFIDRGRIYGRVLSAEEVWEAGGFYADPDDPMDDPLMDGLVNWWPFEGAVGDVVGGLENGTGGAVLGDDFEGFPQSALEFDGSGPFVFNTSTSITATEVSFGGFFRLDRALTSDYWVLLMDTGSFLVELSTYSGLYVQVGGGLTSSAYATSGHLREPAEWFHFFATYDGNVVRVYVNGMEVQVGDKYARDVGPIALPAKDGMVVLGGAVPPSNPKPFDGAMDDVRIYNRVLSAEEIAQLARPDGPPTALANFDPQAPSGVLGAQAGGFLFGTNGYGDRAKAQAFSLPSGASEGSLDGARVHWNYFNDAWTFPVRLQAWSGTPQSGPTELLYESPAFYLGEENIGDDENGPATPVTLATRRVNVPKDFFLALDFGAYQEPFNRLAIRSSAPVGHRVPGVWEAGSDGTWANVSDAWWGGGDGAELWVEALVSGPVATAVESRPDEVPSTVVLEAAYPNPFNPSTIIPFQIPDPTRLHLAVYDALGRLVRTLEDGMKEAGYHTATLDGSGLASGVYLVRLRAGKEVHTRRVILLK